MDSQRYLEAQTRLTDLFLPELARATLPNLDVNFNNTRQFDALLRYLELTLQVPTFMVVPSTNVLHILLTLSCRCSTSNWTHKVSSLEGIAGSTEYMKQVNADYDHTLYKSLILERSRRILEKYIQLIAEGDLTALVGLNSHLHKVVLTLLPTSFMSFFSPRKAGSNDSREHIKKLKKASKADPEPELPASRVDLLGLPKQSVVEFISDSEESDSILEVEQPHEVASKYRQFGLPLRSITSLSDLGNKTSGLGETTLLFKNMPHLLANATPEPEETSKPNAKRSRVSANPMDTIHVYDEPLLAKKLQSSETFDIWNLLRWMFDCADSASQYQRFLFNSSQTNVHCIYVTYEGFFKMLFNYFAVDCQNPSSKNRFLLDRLLALLGPKQDWYDRAVEYVFTGLGIPTNSKCYPCYDRERLLIKYDPAILISRCKQVISFTDNHRSMELRWLILCLLYVHGHVLASNVEDLVANLTSKLAEVEMEYLAVYFRCFSMTIQNVPVELLLEFECVLVNLLLGEVTNLKFPSWVQEAKMESNVKNVCETLTSERLFSSISDDLSYKSFAEFKDKWTKVEFLVSWMLNKMLMEVMKADLQTQFRIILKAARQADANSTRFYYEFLESRSEDADIRAEDINFELSTEEVSNYKRGHKSVFHLMAKTALHRSDKPIFVF
ncbi:CIC11C00000000798 [Sungouiella intermedia]|uniref:CIC11C00000000798 n=1 Tax=Sungouiella intermedia TaxID=45354 RepID=A0A1L0BWY2_9ASCO|nr:CIC11C00000000798 [[Candida] intermedia]